MSLSLIAVSAFLLAGGQPPSAPSPAAPTGWSRQDAETLVFQGRITEASRDAFSDLIDDATRTVIVTSRGGDADAALDIANAIRDRDLDVVVRGHCISSCANYLFLAGRRKIVEADSFLGFHGTLTSMNLDRQIARMTEAAQAGGMSADEITAEAESMRATIEGYRTRESAFAQRIGFEPALLIDTGFERLTAEERARLPDGDPVLFPSAELLARCYGVSGVEDRARADDPDLETLAERGAPGLGIAVLGDDWLPVCD